MITGFWTDTIQIGCTECLIIDQKRTTSQKTVDALIAYEKRWYTTSENHVASQMNLGQNKT